jgi:TatD DNase family protein
MQLVDTHAHLEDGKFDLDRAAMIDRAAAAGVTRMMTIATTSADSRTCVLHAQSDRRLRASVGIHPNHVAEERAGAWDEILRLVKEPSVTAIGETGLDRHWDRTPFAQQEECFGRHLDLSRSTGLPIVIHCREADADMLRMLRAEFDRHGPIRGVMHSFVGDTAMAEACLAMGLVLSFAGMLTYKNAEELRRTAATVPLERVLVETDSPYLAPLPMRGKRNEPAHVVHTARQLAEIHGLPLAAIAERTTANAIALFRFDEGEKR